MHRIIRTILYRLQGADIGQRVHTPNSEESEDNYSRQAQGSSRTDSKKSQCVIGACQYTKNSVSWPNEALPMGVESGTLEGDGGMRPRPPIEKSAREIPQEILIF